jgi:hypothetical protein
MTDELQAKRIQLITKRVKLEKDLARVCHDMANVDKELQEVKDKMYKHDDAPADTVDPHIESIQKLVCILHGLEKEDVEVMRWYKYASKVESELPRGYSEYFDTKKYILDERDNLKVRIVDIREDTYMFVEEVSDQGPYKYVVVFPNWPNRY